MQMIGVLGGMSWVSTASYYARLNELAAKRLGGLGSAQILLRSVDFAPVAAAQACGDWGRLERMMADEARRLEDAGAGLIVIATNTMHMAADAVRAAVAVPLIHIADATALAIRSAGQRQPGLIATAFTMEMSFYRDRLIAAGLLPVLPDEMARGDIQRIIYDELCRGNIRPESRARFAAIAADLREAGADSLILGCTEVGLLLGPHNVDLPVFDTVDLHCRAAIEAAFDDQGEITCST